MISDLDETEMQIMRVLGEDFKRNPRNELTVTQLLEKCPKLKLTRPQLESTLDKLWKVKYLTLNTRYDSKLTPQNFIVFENYIGEWGDITQQINSLMEKIDEFRIKAKSDHFNLPFSQLCKDISREPAGTFFLARIMYAYKYFEVRSGDEPYWIIREITRDGEELLRQLKSTRKTTSMMEAEKIQPKLPTEPSKKMKIFLCGTDDVRDIMDTLYHELEIIEGIQPIWFHKNFPITTGNAMDECLKCVRESDRLIWVIDKRYGLPYDKEKNISISETEFMEAYKLKKPVLVLIRMEIWVQAGMFHKVAKEEGFSKKTNEEKLRYMTEHGYKADLGVYESIERLMHLLEVPWIEGFQFPTEILGKLQEKWGLKAPSKTPQLIARCPTLTVIHLDNSITPEHYDEDAWLQFLQKFDEECNFVKEKLAPENYLVEEAEKYAKALICAYNVTNRWRHQIQIDLKIKNTGTCPATKVRVELSCPDNSIQFLENYAKSLPEFPHRPSHGMYSSMVLNDFLLKGENFLLGKALETVPHSPDLLDDNFRVRITLEDLPHDDAKSIQIWGLLQKNQSQIKLDFKIIANETPVATVGIIQLELKLPGKGKNQIFNT